MTTIAYDDQIFTHQRFGGISRYFCEVAARLGKRPDCRVRVVAPLYSNDYLAEGNVPHIGWHMRMPPPQIGRLVRGVNALLTPPLLAALRADVLHRTYFGLRQRPSRGRLVVTVFDMVHELFPHHFPAGDPTRRDKRHAVETADHVICISHSTAADLRRLLGVPAQKVSVTHLGLSEAFASVAAASGETPSDAPARPYFLYVGHRAGYKNFERLLAAYAASARLWRDFDLVAFGGPPFDGEELARIERLGLRQGAVRREAGSDAALARAYARAQAFVYPSEYEGFGIPPLEAMSCGCPVLCSDVSSVPEVVGAAGSYFDPTDIDAIRAALERVAGDEPYRQTLIAAGHRQRRQFSWDQCADETMAVYRSLA